MSRFLKSHCEIIHVMAFTGGFKPKALITPSSAPPRRRRTLSRHNGGSLHCQGKTPGGCTTIARLIGSNLAGDSEELLLQRCPGSVSQVLRDPVVFVCLFDELRSPCSMQAAPRVYRSLSIRDVRYWAFGISDMPILSKHSISDINWYQYLCKRSSQKLIVCHVSCHEMNTSLPSLWRSTCTN